MYKACTGKEKPGASKFYSPRLELIFGSQTTSAAEDTDFAVPKELHLHSASLLFSFQSLPSHLAMWGAPEWLGMGLYIPLWDPFLAKMKDLRWPALSCHQLVEWKASESLKVISLISLNPGASICKICISSWRDIFHHFSQACRNCCKAPEHPRHVGSTGPAGHGSDWAESHKMDVVSGCQPSVSDLIDRSGKGSSLGRGKRI